MTDTNDCRECGRTLNNSSANFPHAGPAKNLCVSCKPKAKKKAKASASKKK